MVQQSQSASITRFALGASVRDASVLTYFVSARSKEMTRPEMIKKARIARLECILLGIALAQEGDREKILNEFEGEEFQSDIVGDCIHAIRTQDSIDIRVMLNHLKTWGLEVSQGKIVNVLIKKLRQDSVTRRFEDALDDVKNSDSHDEFLDRAEQAISLVKELVEVK